MKFYTRSLRKVLYWHKDRIWGSKEEVKTILYDEKGRPGLTAPASLSDKIRYIRDWFGKEPLIWPDDFDGEMRPDGTGHRFTKV